MNQGNSTQGKVILGHKKLESSISSTIKNSLVRRLLELQRLLLLTLPKIEPQWLWQQPSTHIPCIGVQLRHMEGNLKQYIVVNLSGQKDKRERKKEFERDQKISLEQLSEGLLNELQQARALIDRASSSVWNEDYKVQGFSMTRLEACIHGVEHLNYHLGQIALLVKYYKPQDLGYYPEISQN